MPALELVYLNPQDNKQQEQLASSLHAQLQYHVATCPSRSLILHLKKKSNLPLETPLRPPGGPSHCPGLRITGQVTRVLPYQEHEGGAWGRACILSGSVVHVNLHLSLCPACLTPCRVSKGFAVGSPVHQGLFSPDTESLT